MVAKHTQDRTKLYKEDCFCNAMSCALCYYMEHVDNPLGILHGHLWLRAIWNIQVKSLMLLSTISYVLFGNSSKHVGCPLLEHGEL